jgi:hypothetical protein
VERVHLIDILIDAPLLIEPLGSRASADELRALRPMHSSHGASPMCITGKLGHEPPGSFSQLP